MRPVGAAFESAALERGWRVQRVKVTETFTRLLLSEDEQLLVDLAIDAPPRRAPVVSLLGPSFDGEELAGRKLIALFDRAEARDFVDVFYLARRFGTGSMISQAGDIDGGFDVAVLAQMMRSLDRFKDTEIPIEVSEVDGLRAFFAGWADEIERPQ